MSCLAPAFSLRRKVTEVTDADAEQDYDEGVISPEQLLGLKPASAGIQNPLDHLLACHRRIEDRLATLERVAAHLSTNRAEALAAAGSCFRFFETSGIMHTADEEQSVFPRLRRALDATELKYLETLEEQHKEADSAYAGLKEVAAAMEGIPGDLPSLLIERYRQTVARLVGIYRAHIASEDEVLIALGRRILTPEQQAAIAAEMRARRGI